MKKFLAVLGLLAIVGTVSSCKEKRCACVSKRTGYPAARSYEPKTGSSCVDTLQYMASDSMSLIIKICAEEE